MALPDPSAAPELGVRAGFNENTMFRSLLAAYPDAMLVVDKSGVIVLANGFAATMLGYSTQELVGMNVDLLVPDAVRPRHAEFRQAYGRNPRPRPMGNQMDLVALCKDGSKVMVEIALSPFQDQGEQFAIAAIRNIEAYPRVQQAVRRARYSEHLARLGRLAVDTRDHQVLLDHAPAVVAEALQVEAVKVYLLDATHQHFNIVSGMGVVANEEAGQRVANLPDTLPGYVLTQEKTVVVADFSSEQRFVVPQTYLDAGLTSALAVPLYDRSRVVGAVVARSRQAQRFGADEELFLQSVSDLLATSVQRAQTEEALSHSQRLESVGQLTGGIAHDFNNLLTVILGNLQVLRELDAGVQDEHTQQLLDAAAQASRRGADLTGKLLAFSRRQVLRPSAVDLQLMLQSLAAMLRRILDQQIEIEVDVAADCPAVLADPGQLESGLLNIAINARDAMPDGGVLRFVAAPCVTLPAVVLSGSSELVEGPEQFVAIAVSDTGSGMTGEVKERAFEPFYTTKEAGRGTGLGLSTVYGFVKQTKGAVTIDSEIGSGTTVTFYIPRAHEVEQAVDGPDGNHPAFRVGLRVLLVDDDSDVLRVVRALLEGLDCNVTSAANAEQAIALLATGAAFELLLTDVALGPGMRGTQLAERALHCLPDLAVVLMSGFSADLIDADNDVPADWELLAKPFGRSDLANAISGALAGRSGDVDAAAGL